MPYKTNEDLPEGVTKHLPGHGLDIYREAYNHALQEYKDPQKRKSPEDDLEAIAHKVAWSAVKRKYKKGDDGMWVPKENS